jgi:hypothetical protein
MDEGQVRDTQYSFVLGTMLHDLSYKTTFLKLVRLGKNPDYTKVNNSAITDFVPKVWKRNESNLGVNFMKAFMR